MPKASHFTPSFTLVRPAIGHVVAWLLADATPLGFRGVIEPPDVGEGDDGDLAVLWQLAAPLAVAATGAYGALGERDLAVSPRGGSYLTTADSGGPAVSPDGSSVASLLIDADNQWRVRLHRRRTDGPGWELSQTIYSPAGFSAPTDAGRFPGTAIPWLSAQTSTRSLCTAGRVHVNDGRDGSCSCAIPCCPPIRCDGSIRFSIALLTI